MVAASRYVGSRSRSRNAFQRDEGSEPEPEPEPEGAVDDGCGHFGQREDSYPATKPESLGVHRL